VFQAVALQLLVFSFLAAFAAVAWEPRYGLHLLLGGLTAWVPNALFALRLSISRGRGRESDLAVFFVGEFVKIGLTVGFIVLTAYNVPDLQWMPWLIGLIASIKVPLLFGIRVR
jgi:ATP synthase protein I